MLSIGTVNQTFHSVLSADMWLRQFCFAFPGTKLVWMVSFGTLDVILVNLQKIK